MKSTTTEGRDMTTKLDDEALDSLMRSAVLAGETIQHIAWPTLFGRAVRDAALREAAEVAEQFAKDCLATEARTVPVYDMGIGAERVGAAIRSLIPGEQK